MPVVKVSWLRAPAFKKAVGNVDIPAGDPVERVMSLVDWCGKSIVHRKRKA